ncbi:MAG TPA: QsdR family transcriptional regulator [Kofleriaceae bacterium]|nr:QsdR family transcriptional regulator [Kofleriaceae bacterium]
MTHRTATPLSRLVDGDEQPTKVTPRELLKLARKKWLHGERLDLGKLAADLGIGRATVFRWAGSREQLYGELIASGLIADLDRARVEATGSGIERMFDVIDRLLRSLAASEPLRTFIRQDPEYALRVLTAKGSPVQARSQEAFREGIVEQIAAGTMAPALPPDDLAYLLTRIVESFLYRDVITGDEPNMAMALAAIRILCLCRV